MREALRRLSLAAFAAVAVPVAAVAEDGPAKTEVRGLLITRTGEGIEGASQISGKDSEECLDRARMVVQWSCNIHVARSVCQENGFENTRVCNKSLGKEAYCTDGRGNKVLQFKYEGC